jgi:hypothetical protein
MRVSKTGYLALAAFTETNMFACMTKSLVVRVGTHLIKSVECVGGKRNEMRVVTNARFLERATDTQFFMQDAFHFFQQESAVVILLLILPRYLQS